VSSHVEHHSKTSITTAEVGYLLGQTWFRIVGRPNWSTTEWLRDVKFSARWVIILIELLRILILTMARLIARIMKLL